MRPKVFAKVTLGIGMALAGCHDSSGGHLFPKGETDRFESASDQRIDEGRAQSPTLWAELDLAKHPEANAVSKDGVEVRLTVVEGKPEVVDGVQYAAEKQAVAHIKYQGLPPMSLPLVKGVGGSWRSIQIGIGKLNRSDSTLTTLIQAYWGGAHCCQIVTAVVAGERSLQVIDFPVIDGEGLQEFPEDLNHDGHADFVIDDTRLMDVFSSHAGSRAPPRILNVVNNRLVDVSGLPGFAPMFEDFARTARDECADAAREGATDRNGVCAGYVAASARLGRFDAAIKEAAAWASDDPPSLSHCNSTLVDKSGWGSCPKGQEIKFQSFEAGLRWLLQESGYIDPASSAALPERHLRCGRIKSSDDASSAKYQTQRLLC